MKKILMSFLIVMLALSLLPQKVSAQDEPDTWSIYRPSIDVPSINARVQNATTDDEATVGIGVEILRYFEDATDYPYEGPTHAYADGVRLKAVATANTRKGIEYQWQSGFGLTDWIEADTPIPGMESPQDNDVQWIPLPFPVRFYGGPGYQNESFEYDGVWVSSNGFLSFDTESVSPNPQPIPSPEEPNALLAVYWSDLDPSGGSIKYYASAQYFAVMWRNVLDKNNGHPQTFEVIIEDTQIPTVRGQNRIKFLYESVTWSSSARVGIEDQEGYKGAMPNPRPQSGQSCVFLALEKAPEIREVKITLKKESDSYAEIYTTPTEWALRGYNVAWEKQQRDEGGAYEVAFKGFLTLLMTTAVGLAYGPAAGLALKTTLLSLETCAALARSTWSAYNGSFENADEPGEDVAFVSAPGAYYGWGTWPVDASLANQFEWVFTDDNSEDHSVTATAELKYYSYEELDFVTISTSVDLDVLIGQHTLSISASAGGTTVPQPGLYPCDYGEHVPVYAYRTDPDFEFDHWELDSVDIGDANPYDLIVRSDHTLTAYFRYIGNGDPPGGCPFVSTWNGTDYVLDNNLLPASETSNGTDIVDYYKLEQPSVLDDDGRYRLLLSEFENEHDFFDYVQLITVDHLSDVNVAVSPYGEILTYTEPSSPVSAIDDNNRNVKRLLDAIDGDYYEGYNGSYIVLNFGDELDVSSGAKLVMRADSRPLKIPSIHVQIQDEANNWNTVATVIPRGEWATEIFDLSEYLPDAKGNLKVRVYFTAWHKIDFVGLDTSEQRAFEVHYASPAEAIHSTLGDVKEPLTQSDNMYAELLPGEQITLRFTLPQSTEDVRDFIIIVEGHYFTITP